ncbi:hypothetical protein EGQ24_00200, partial [bacterium]|nr:hypothetical protein [bacterium]
ITSESLYLALVTLCNDSNNERFREKVSPVYNPNSQIKEFSGSPEARLTPLNRSEIRKEANSFAPSENNFNYNSSCQFGVCLQNRETPLFQKAQ